MMTRNDYELLAKALKESKPADFSSKFWDVRHGQWETDVRAIALVLSNQNARFNFNTFYTACGLELVKK